MASRNDHFSNLAFGGSWSEDRHHDGEMLEVLDLIEAAAARCDRVDVQSEAFLEAMLFVRRNIAKGAYLSVGMFRALRVEDPALRKEDAMRIAVKIREWAGY